jgi:hypothetical protein
MATTKKPRPSKAKPAAPKPKTARHVLSLGACAGNITVCDFAYLLEHGADLRKRARFALLSVPAGRCAISVDIPGTANGRIREKLTLNVTAGRLFVGDAAFAFSRGWDEFLNQTNYLLERNERFRSFDTGADGAYKVTVGVPVTEG